MTKQEKIISRLVQDSDFKSSIDKIQYYDEDAFYSDALAYIKAIKEGRMICNIGKVSQSGMSRTIKFLSCEKIKNTHDNKVRYSYRQYWSFFKVLGYRTARSNQDYFSISGCGMDMIFNTNYNIIRTLKRFGFLSKAECGNLSQAFTSSNCI